MGIEARRLLERCVFPPPQTAVTCAVSGGADSLALLVLAVEAGCAVTAIHVDHGLRPGSADEAELVHRVAAQLGARARSERVEVVAGPNLEARARAARYAVLPADVMTGHTADDQAETVLLNLVRGAGLDGAAGLQPGFRHPLLALRRSETRSLCSALDIVPFDDPSNDDPRFRRNRVRHELLPMLDDIAQRDVVPLLARFSGVARDAAAYLESQADAIDPTDARTLADSPPALARVAVRRWLRECSGERHPPDAATVERVLDVARGHARATEIGGGRSVARTRGRLRIEPPTAEAAATSPGGAE